MKQCIRAAVLIASFSLSGVALAQTGGSTLVDTSSTSQQQREAAQDAEQRARTAEDIGQAETEDARRDAAESEERARVAEDKIADADAKAAEADAKAAEADAKAAEAAAAAAAASAAAAAALAAADEVDPGYYEGRWVGALGISGSFNLTSLNRVPGAPRGVSVGINVSADGVLDYLKAKHEWRNSLTIGAGLLRSASDSIWVKTNDILKIQSGYYYALSPAFGPFVEFQFQTAMFPMTVRRNGDANFCLEGVDLATCAAGTGGVVESQGDKLKLSGAFQPVQMHEKFGIFIRPVDRTYFRMALRTGFGAQQFYVKNGSTFVETNRNAAGDAILIRELHTYGLFGFIADLNIRGAAKSEGVLYGANAALLIPLADTSRGRRRADGDVNGTQVDLGAFLTFKISSWASLDVRGGAARVPQVTGNKWQTSIMTLLTFSYAVVGDLDTAREDAMMLRGVETFEGAKGSLEPQTN